MHKYFVSYSFSTGHGFGNGSLEVDLKDPVRSMEDVELIRNFIENTYRGKGIPEDADVVVTYWRRFEEDE